MSQGPSDGKALESNDLPTDHSERAAPGAARDAEEPIPPEVAVGAQPPEAQIESELRYVTGAWKDLPEHIRAAILTLVQAAETQP